jgi:DNA-binding LytR/AlgR family response regulator
MTLAEGRVVLHLAERRHRVVDAGEIYYLEAQGDETDVRLRSAGRLREIRSLGEVMRDLAPFGFVRIHRNHAVNPGRIREIRPAATGSLWEVRLEPPVNEALGISRGSLPTLLAAYRSSATLRSLRPGRVRGSRRRAGRASP